MRSTMRGPAELVFIRLGRLGCFGAGLRASSISVRSSCSYLRSLGRYLPMVPVYMYLPLERCSYLESPCNHGISEHSESLSPRLRRRETELFDIISSSLTLEYQNRMVVCLYPHTYPPLPGREKATMNKTDTQISLRLTSDGHLSKATFDIEIARATGEATLVE